MLPGYRDYVPIIEADRTEVKLHMKILLMTVMEAFQMFKLEYPKIKKGKSKFVSLHPLCSTSFRERSAANVMRTLAC
jgi:hypothetical protein